MSAPALSLVIPLHNEAGSIAILQREIREVLADRSFELILVDDGSTDGTLEALERTPEVRVIARAKRAGQSAALLAGIRATSGAVIVLLDGDLQNDPRDIPALLAALEAGADLACGIRVQRRDALSKRISSTVANAIRRLILRDAIQDSGCTFKAMRRECAEALPAFDGMHRFIPALAQQAGFRVTQVAVNHRPRLQGKSNYGFRNRILTVAVDLIGVRWIISRSLKCGGWREVP